MTWNLIPWRRRLPRPHHRLSRRPALELLEDRVVPTVLDPNFTETVFVNSPQLNLATGMAWAPDDSGRLFVTRKGFNDTGAEIRIIDDGVLLPSPFATVSPIFTASECGLIGIAFDRDFINNHFVYVFATVSSSEQQIIRYTANGNVGTNKTVILGGLPTKGANHDGGGIGIGPDNKLYFAIGDQGDGTGVNDDLTTLASKIGRANLDGTPVHDNPFNDNDGVTEPTDYIWARGFRNPFTLTFQELPGQAVPGRLWVDVAGTLYEQIFQVNAGDHAGWNNYENTQPPGFIPPKIKYRTNGTDTRTLGGGPGPSAVRNNNVATFSTTVAHGFRMGEKITVAGVADPSFNGSFYIASTPSATTFTVSQTGPNASSGGGTAQTQNLGGAVTGGAFYNSNGFLSPYHGNFFFADYNSDRINRATLDAANNITSVDYFITDVGNAVDVATGPDGALYYIGVTNQTVFRTDFNHSGNQKLIVTPRGQNLVEGGAGVIAVRLSLPPVSNVTVTVTRTAGDTDLNVTSGGTLTFTPANWATPQYAFLAAAEDADLANDTATFSISGALQTQTVTVGAIDNEVQALVLSTTTLTINEGGSGTFTVQLAHQPAGNVSVNVARTAGDTDITVAGGANLTFTPANWNTPQTVTIAAAEDADAVNDTATISVTSPGIQTQTVAVTAVDNDPLPAEIIIDNGEPGYAEVGNWYDWDGVGYNNKERYTDPGTPNKASWQVTGVPQGTFSVWATWMWGNTNATYQIFDGPTLRATVGVNQSQEPNGPTFGNRPFQPLGTNIVTNSGTVRVELLAAPPSGGWVLADAVRFLLPTPSGPIVTIAATDPDASEPGSNTGTFTVSRTGSTGSALTVNYAISGTATNGGDYQMLTGTVQIPAGQVSAPIVVTPIDDPNPEATETVILTITAGPGYTPGNPGQATVNIIDNDGPPPPSAFIIDNFEPGYSEVGDWYDFDVGYNNKERYTGPGGSNTATWQASGLAAGTYTVQATWMWGNATAAPYSIFDGNTLKGTVAVNQSQEPSGPSFGGRPFQGLGSFTINSGTIKIVLGADPSGWAIADAVRVSAAGGGGAGGLGNGGPGLRPRDGGRGLDPGANELGFQLGGDGIDYALLFDSINSMPPWNLSAPIVVMPMDDTIAEDGQALIAKLLATKPEVADSPDEGDVIVTSQYTRLAIAGSNGLGQVKEDDWYAWPAD
jgi:glucose/arabinose dehydrogenase